VQVHQYYNNFSSDTTQLKSFVAFVFALETVHAVLVSYYAYYYWVEHYGELVYLTRSTSTAAGSVFIGLVIAWSVNQFLVYRIYILSEKNLWLSAVISVLATIRPAFGITGVVFVVKYPEWETFVRRAQWIMTTGLAIGVVVDGLITICISYYLLKGRNRVIVSTRNIINTLLKYTLNTGAILMIFASLELIAIVVWPHSLTFVGILHVQVKLYANCFLTILSARHVFRHTMDSSIESLASPSVTEREVYW
jgi:hypothetical protein